jgi:hypothetical protein
MTASNLMHEEATQNAYQRGLQDGSRQAQPPSGSG